MPAAVVQTARFPFPTNEENVTLPMPRFTRIGTFTKVPLSEKAASAQSDPALLPDSKVLVAPAVQRNEPAV